MAGLGIRPRRSRQVKLANGEIRSFSNLSDYVEAYVEAGVVKNKDDLIRNYRHLLTEIFFDWIKQGQAGCLFAVKLARLGTEPSRSRKEGAHWESLVVSNALRKDDLGGFLNEKLDAAASTSGACQLILPDIETQEQAVEFVRLLCRNDRWYWTKIEWKRPPDLSCLVGLRWILRDDQSVNHVLGFAPFNSMPVTRQAPFTALVLRIRSLKRTKEKRENGRVQVHLADLDSRFHPQERHDRVWRRTQDYKSQLIFSEAASSQARARITFALDRRFAEHLPGPTSIAESE